MKLKLSHLLILLLLPAFAEALDGKVFLISIPGFPLSLGRSIFVISGLILLLKDRAQILKNKIFLGFALIFLGLLFASFLFGSDDAIMKSLAFILLFVGAFGLVNFWGRLWGRQVIDVFFIALFLYWSVKSLGQTIANEFVSYSELYQEGEVVNHHVPGMLVSVSSAYLAVRYFYSEKGLNLKGYLVFFISLLTCLFIESRSNFIISFLIMSFISLRVISGRTKRIIIALPLLTIMFFSLNRIIQGNEILQRRFTLYDIEYQEKTSGMRIAYIEQGLKEFNANLLGKGIIDTSLEYRGRRAMIHNQYLTFMVGGGTLTLIGLIVFFVGFLKLIKHIFYCNGDKSELSYRFIYSLTISCITFFLTLLTIEMTGLLFFFLISFLLFIEKESLNLE